MTFEETLAKEGVLIYTTTGVSMRPLLRQRLDIVEIRPKGPGRCQKYDVVLYKRHGHYILHRILKVRTRDYVIAGDHNIWREYGITDDQILGVLTRIIRNGKTITPDRFLYRLYAHLWADFFPIRAAILYGRRLIHALPGKMKRILTGRKPESGERRKNGAGSE